MPKISFADDAISQVISGAKCETLRVGEDYPVGEVLQFVRQNGSQVGFLTILDKSRVKFSEVGESDVRSHNAGTLERLRMRLLSFYPELTADSVLTRYRFKFGSNFELDHIFIFVTPGGHEAALLSHFGLKEGGRRTHQGQGTSNRVFPFHNACLELIWASDEAEIRSKQVEPLGKSIDIATNSGQKNEPLLFIIPEVVRPELRPCEKKPIFNHLSGFADITGVRIQQPQSTPLSSEWAALTGNGVVSLSQGGCHHIELTFDRGSSGREHRFDPGLPLSFIW